MKYCFYGMFFVAAGFTFLHMYEDLPIPDNRLIEMLLCLIGIAITDKE